MIDVEAEKHRLVFPQERGLLKGSSLLAQKIKGLGLKLSKEVKPAKRLATDTKKEANEKVREEISLSHKWGYRGAEDAYKECSNVG